MLAIACRRYFALDLTTHYLDLELKNPFVPSSSPLSKTLDSARQLEDYGAGAIVMHSLFQEQIEESIAAEHGSVAGGDLFGSSQVMASRDQYLEQFRQLKEALDIPIIPSLNGTLAGNWLHYASELETAGAEALELNVYYVAGDISETADSVEQRLINVLRSVKEQVSIPIGIKLSPYFSSLGHLVTSLEANGASSIALFNRFYQPNVDLESLAMSPALELSTSGDALLAMRWIAILYGRTKLSLAATGGVHFAEDALKVLLCGADVTYLGSTLLANGPKQLARIHDNTVKWLIEHNYESIAQIKGLLSQAKSPDPAAFERGHYIKLLSSYKI
jgi:dihydroorotate dehydrogenase (fumarate)